jgi:hypothetical protein
MGTAKPVLTAPRNAEIEAFGAAGGGWGLFLTLFDSTTAHILYYYVIMAMVAEPNRGVRAYEKPLLTGGSHGISSFGFADINGVVLVRNVRHRRAS